MAQYFSLSKVVWIEQVLVQPFVIHGARVANRSEAP